MEPQAAHETGSKAKLRATDGRKQIPERMMNSQASSQFQNNLIVKLCG
jgi:hypothetical protein